MTHHIGLLTTGASLLLEHDHDTVPLVKALQEAGFRADAPVWDDASVDWAGYDLLVIRSPWDYPERYLEFMGWLQETSRRTRILNAPDLIRWNIDKRYLADFQAQGVPCVPFVFCESPAEVTAAIKQHADGRIVVKPSVSAGSRHTGLFDPADPAALALAERILADGKTVMVQPAAEHVITNGENALFFLNGSYAYAIHKGPILAPGGGYVGGGEYTENITPAEPSEAEIALGRRVLEAVETIAAGKGFSFDARFPLYARVDIALAAGGAPEIIEVEVFEPSYFVGVVPAAAGHFVEAVTRRLHAPTTESPRQPD